MSLFHIPPTIQPQLVINASVCLQNVVEEEDNVGHQVIGKLEACGISATDVKKLEEGGQF